jgi:hypothetical protein
MLPLGLGICLKLDTIINPVKQYKKGSKIKKHNEEESSDSDEERCVLYDYILVTLCFVV